MTCSAPLSLCYAQRQMVKQETKTEQTTIYTNASLKQDSGQRPNDCGTKYKKCNIVFIAYMRATQNR